MSHISHLISKSSIITNSLSCQHQNVYNLLNHLADDLFTNTDPKEANTSPNGNHVAKDSYSLAVQHFNYDYFSTNSCQLGLLC